MARRTGLLHAIAQAQRENERRQKAQQRIIANNQSKAAIVAEKARKDYEKALIASQKDYEKAQKATQKEQERLYLESRITQVDLQNEQLKEQIDTLEHLLLESLPIDSYINFSTLKQIPNLPVFNPGALAHPEPPPQVQTFLPPPLSAIQKVIPGAKDKHARETAKAQEQFQISHAAYSTREMARNQALSQAYGQYEQYVADEKQKIAKQHAEIDSFQRDFIAGSPQAIIDYFTMVLSSSSYPDSFPHHTKLVYMHESKQLAVEYDLPSIDVIPIVSSYKYTKIKDSITETSRSPVQRKALYSSVIAQMTLRTISELFRADHNEYLDLIVLNGYVDTIDKGTGRARRTCLITLRTSREIFMNLNLSHVDPQVCLATLNATISKSPAELAPVRPVLDLNMVDPRFIEELDVLSDLDQRPNLMELTPSEFESLITNLFQKMGLETRLTQASRDGGVDCVAFDPRPIFGGKVVIQAKRYKNTVGVSSVRDLYGTMQNEGASKGILVTTSDYGKASFEFADGKPLELLSGSNLLYLLKEHANIEAKIQVPENWKDQLPDS